MITPNRPLLWKLMRRVYDAAPLAPMDADDDWNDRHGYAAEIRAVAEWIEKCQVEDYGRVLADVRDVIEWLTTEADRAERGDG